MTPEYNPFEDELTEKYCKKCSKMTMHFTDEECDTPKCRDCENKTQNNDKVAEPSEEVKLEEGETEEHCKKCSKITIHFIDVQDGNLKCKSCEDKTQNNDKVVEPGEKVKLEEDAENCEHCDEVTNTYWHALCGVCYRERLPVQKDLEHKKEFYREYCVTCKRETKFYKYPNSEKQCQTCNTEYDVTLLEYCRTCNKLTKHKKNGNSGRRCADKECRAGIDVLPDTEDNKRIAKIRAIQLYLEGVNIARIAYLVGYTYRSVQAWVTQPVNLNEIRFLKPEFELYTTMDEKYSYKSEQKIVTSEKDITLKFEVTTNFDWKLKNGKRDDEHIFDEKIREGHTKMTSSPKAKTTKTK